MNINRNYLSAQNTYANNNPQYIVVHNTDNFSAGANALAHAKAQHNGNFDGMSAHYYTDDGDTVYQATEHNRGTWHVGKNYGGRLFGTVNNRDSIGVEMCVQKNYNYEKAFQNTVELVRQLMAQTGIPADRVLQHYDVCAKNCPSQIRAKVDWQRFKSLISGAASKPVQPEQPAQSASNVNNATIQAGQQHCNNFCNAGLATDGLRGDATKKGGNKALQQALNLDCKAGLAVDGYFQTKSLSALSSTLKGKALRLGDKQYLVTALQILLMLKGYNPNGVESPGNFGGGCDAAVRQYQRDHGLTEDGKAGYDTFKSLIS